jgi:hypothetical protein
VLVQAASKSVNAMVPLRAFAADNVLTHPIRLYSQTP